MDDGHLTGPFPHRRDFLTFCDPITLLYEELTVVAVGAQIRVVVLDDNKLPVAYKSTSAIHNLTLGGCHNRLSGASANVDSLATQSAFTET